MISARDVIKSKPKLFLYEWSDEELELRKDPKARLVFFKANFEIYDPKNPLYDS